MTSTKERDHEDAKGNAKENAGRQFGSGKERVSKVTVFRTEVLSRVQGLSEAENF